MKRVFFSMLGALMSILFVPTMALACYGGNACPSHSYHSPAPASGPSLNFDVSWSGFTAGQGQTAGRKGVVESVAQDNFKLDLFGGLNANTCSGSCPNGQASILFRGQQHVTNFAQGWDFGHGPRAAGAAVESIGSVYFNGNVGF